MPFENLWLHPKTTIAGLILGLLAIAPVLAGQGITLGKAGTGTVLNLVVGLGTVILGLLAKDPSAPTQSDK
ncbi:MAG: hypothetical protein WCA89_09640 [Terracidiphilus sp.]|jgi:hypothetical protein